MSRRNPRPTVKQNVDTDDMSLLLSPPKNPRTYKPALNFDPTLTVYRGIAEDIPQDEILTDLQKKCGDMQKDMKKLLAKISKRNELEMKYTKVETKIKQLDREIGELHYQLLERY